jgi:hypothetical protein
LAFPERPEALPLFLRLRFGFTFFAFTARFAGAAKFPPGACGTLPGTSSGAGLVSGPWQASPEHGRRSVGAGGKPPPTRAS